MSHLATSVCVLICLTAVLRADETFNSPVRIAEMDGDWQLEVPPGEYPQLLRLNPGGRGTWSRNVATHPFSFAWFVEEHDLVMFYYGHSPNFQWRVKEKRLPYELSAESAAQPPPRAEPGRPRRRATVKNLLTLKDDDKTLVFKRTLLQPKFDPELGGVQLRLKTDDFIRATAMILDADGQEVRSIPYFTVIGTYRQGAYSEFPPGKYVVLAAAEGKAVAKATVELVAGLETPVRVYLERGEPRIDVSPPREKQGLNFDDDSP